MLTRSRDYMYAALSPAQGGILGMAAACFTYPFKTWLQQLRLGIPLSSTSDAFTGLGLQFVGLVVRIAMLPPPCILARFSLYPLLHFHLCNCVEASSSCQDLLAPPAAPSAPATPIVPVAPGFHHRYSLAPLPSAHYPRRPRSPPCCRRIAYFTKGSCGSATSWCCPCCNRARSTPAQLCRTSCATASRSPRGSRRFP